MESCSKQKWEDLNLSRDELKSIGEALKKEEFRNLLVEYVKEINDPENRRQYEEEITQLENERGVDVKFVHPSAGYVIKTSVNGKSKAFVNICSNNNVEEPSSVPDISGGQKGLRWSLPYCLAPPREDVDKKNNLCMVFDVVFHPDTLHISKSNTAFKKLVEDTALGAVEDAYKVSLDKINLKYPKMQFKGAKHATVIRKKIEDFKPTEYTDLPSYPYPSPSEESEKLQQTTKSFQRNHKTNIDKSNGNLKHATPNYTLKYRNNIDMQDFTNDPMTKMTASVPSELVIEIDLPLLKHSSDLSVDVTENSVFLVSESPAKYKLSLKLPYIVDDRRGNAKFDVVKKTLTLTLPVVKQQNNGSKIDFSREDSGIESDNFNGKSNSTSSSDDDGNEKNTVTLHNSDKHKAAFDEQCQNKNTVIPTTQTLLKSDIHYSLPNYSYQLFGEVFNCTLQVPNVNPESVEYCFVKKSNLSGFHLTFLSTGSGFFPVNYAICVLFSMPCGINKDTFSVEVWDNNMIAQISLNSYDVTNKAACYIGSDENHLQKVTLSATDSIDSNFLNEKCEKSNGDILSEDGSESHLVQCLPTTSAASTAMENIFKNDPPQHSESQAQDEENEDYKQKDKEHLKSSEESKDGEQFVGDDLSVFETGRNFDQDTFSTKRPMLKTRTMSESNQSDVGSRKNRGILKIGRSLSESSVDDFASWSAEKEKTKKTVRFSEVISRQTFRMNSSILGQRKKNQRKLKNKKRAQERRLSESGNESEGESEVALARGKDQFNCNRDMEDVWYRDPDSSSCETSEVSEASDVSESDDGQKEDVKAFLPCSSKKNHKRRGKKSARKNASTAKFQFLEN